jgi:ParB family chromosome partitioning protein
MSTASLKSVESNTMVKLDRVRQSPFNPRKTFDKEAMKDLIASIEEKGILVPLLVRPTYDNDVLGYEVVAGERRYRAALALELTDVPVVIREMTDEEAREVQIIENLQRQDLHPLEEADGYHTLQPLTAEQIAKKVGKSIIYVTRRLQLRNLIEPIRKLFFENKIGWAHAFLAARLGPEQQKESLPWLKRGDSPEGFKSEIERHFFLTLKNAPFDTADAKLVPKAGACVDCPKRTGFNKMLFAEIKDADICTDPPCFENKTRAFIKIQVGTHRDAVLLSIADQFGSNRFPAKHLTTWVPAGAENCPDTKEGVIVEHCAYHDSPHKVGSLLKVCTNPKCKTHYPKEPRPDYNSSTGGSRKAEKARKIELRRRGLVFKELASDPFTIDNKKDYRDVLDWAIKQLNNDEARAICNAMQWEIAAAKYGGKDYTGTIQKKLAKLEPAGIHQWLYLVMLAGTDLWFYNNINTTPKALLLEAKARIAGVPLADIAKLAKETKADAKKREKQAAAKSKK